MANVVDYDATAHNVHSVTVFQVDRAEVNRRISVQLKVSAAFVFIVFANTRIGRAERGCS